MKYRLYLESQLEHAYYFQQFVLVLVQSFFYSLLSVLFLEYDKCDKMTRHRENNCMKRVSFVLPYFGMLKFLNGKKPNFLLPTTSHKIPQRSPFQVCSP